MSENRQKGTNEFYRKHILQDTRQEPLESHCFSKDNEALKYLEYPPPQHIYSVKGDTGIQHDSYGRGRRGRIRRHGWGGRGGRSGSKSVAGAAKIKAKKVSDVTFASNLDDAYRRNLKKLREASIKDLSK